MSFEIKKWEPVTNPASKYKATVWCPKCALRIGIVGHDISPTGELSPSLVCPHDPCDFHEYVHLNGWPVTDTGESGEVTPAEVTDGE